MSPATITALAAIFGSLAGALASSVGTWITQRHQTQRDLLEKKILLREQLYSDFIIESARLFMDALEHDLKDADRLIPAYALRNRMRLSSSRAVLASADEVVKNIVGAYAEPNLTPEEIRSRASIWWPLRFALATTYFVFMSRRYAGKVSVKRETQGFY